MSSFVTVPSDFERNRYKQPLIKPASGGKAIAYRRMTSYIDVIADKYKLQQWDKRQVAIGLAQREDLRLSALAHLNDRDILDKVCQDAKEYARASAAATNGTSFHTLTDIVDGGGELPAGLPDNIVKTLDAFREATAELKVVAIEPKTVLDTHKVAGTPDRIYKYKGSRYIGDTKTGTIRFGTQKIAAQLAGYSRSRLYDIKTGARTTHDADLLRGIIMDVDLEACTVNLVWVDLTAGWQALNIAAKVWEQRSLDKFDRLTRPWGDTGGFSLADGIAPDGQPGSDRTVKQILANPAPRPIDQQVREASTRQELEAIWRANADAWTEDLTRLAMERKQALGDTEPPTAA